MRLTISFDGNASFDDPYGLFWKVKAEFSRRGKLTRRFSKNIPNLYQSFMENRRIARIDKEMAPIRRKDA